MSASDLKPYELIQGEKIDQAYLDKWAAELGVTDELGFAREKLREKREQN